MRFAFVVAGLLAATTASADPVDPYAPPPPPQPTTANDQAAPADPVLAEQIAQSLVARAQELLDAKLLVEAKQLAIEAIVRSPKSAAADHARQIVKAVDQELGIPDDKPPVGPGDQPPAAPLPVPVKPLADQPSSDTHVASYVHGGLFGGALGAMIGTTFSSSPAKQAGGAIPLGLVGAAGAAYGVSKLVDRFGWSEAQVRTTGAGSVWGGIVGGLVADIATGTHGTTGRQVLIGGAIGATVGAIGGGAYASQNKLTRGDVALIDTLAGIGAVGGVTLGMIMQPVESEAYSLNSIVGTIGGVVVGLVAAPQTNTTPRRMARVAGLAALGAALPFLLYAAIYTPTSSGDERLVGLLSSGGMVGGAYLGFRLTRGMDEGLDRLDDGKPAHADDAPPGVVTRTSDRQWGLGTIAVAPLSRALDDHQHGTAVTLVGVRF